MYTIDAGELIRAVNDRINEATATMEAATARCCPVVTMADRLEAAGYLPTGRRGHLTLWELPKMV